ncbi:MAG: penicillin acylase family protein, partial [Motiliproteus sp.]
MEKTYKHALIAALVLAVMGCDNYDNNNSVLLEDSITIKRDNWGVPHVYADDTYGVFYGMGYALAEDRLFQMEMAKRSVMGAVSEVLGAEFISVDRRSRGGSSQASIQEQLDALSQDDQDIFNGYANGFNVRMREVMADPDNLMPKEFIDYGFEPLEWTALDVAMIYVGTMANRFSNGSGEIGNLSRLSDLKAGLGDIAGAEMFEQIYWSDDKLSITTVPRVLGVNSFAINDQASKSDVPAIADSDKKLSTEKKVAKVDVGNLARLAPVSDSIMHADSAWEASYLGIADAEDRPVASNLWIVGPNKTVDGSAILNNGPQFGWYNPAYTFSVGLHGGGWEVTGNTPFAHPAILFGTNGVISWGATAGPLDVNDYYQVQLNPGNQYEYFYNGIYRPMTKRSEVIKVKDADDVTLDIYSTVHGAVTSFDLDNGTGYAFKRAWEGLEVESLMGWIHSMQAQNFDEWILQASRVAHTINWYYADSAGNIGYVSPGKLPVRPSGHDIRFPAIGDGSMEWQGFRPFSENPQVLNPAQGFIVNWNNRAGPTDASLGDRLGYSVTDRANEFITRIESKELLTREEVWDLNIKASFADTNARYFLPHIFAAAKGLVDPADPVFEAAQRLANWDMLNTNPTDSDFYAEPAATIFRAWLALMYTKVLADDLPPGFVSTRIYPGRTSGGSVRPGTGSKWLYNAFLGDAAGVPQTFDFFNGADDAGKNEIIMEALQEAVATLTTNFGPDQTTWLTPVTVHFFRDTNFFG